MKKAEMEQTFLVAMIAEPEEEAHRLAYTDWLEDQADPRAEWLRIEQAQYALPPDHPDRETIRKELIQKAENLPFEWLSAVSRPRLADTVWRGDDSDDDEVDFTFFADGKLTYLSSGSYYPDGEWLQIADHVHMRVNESYAQYKGIIQPRTVRGHAWNVVDHTWIWTVRYIGTAKRYGAGKRKKKKK